MPLTIRGTVLEKTQGGLSATGQRPHDCDFLGHLPPGASYHLVEIDLAHAEPPVQEEILNLARFKKQLTDRHNKRVSRGRNEEGYFRKVAKMADRKDKEYKKNAGMFDYEKPEKPVIAYLAEEQELLEEEERKVAAEEVKAEV